MSDQMVKDKTRTSVAYSLNIDLLKGDQSLYFTKTQASFKLYKQPNSQKRSQCLLLGRSTIIRKNKQINKTIITKK